MKLFNVILFIGTMLFAQVLAQQQENLEQNSATTTMMTTISNEDETKVWCARMNNNNCIPVVGLGTSRIGETDADVTRAIKEAVKLGYRHIDTADFYKNEKGIGQALEELIKEGVVTRNDLFITTKVWSNHHTKELALKSIQRSLNDLRLDYLDLVLVHWPMSFQSGDAFVPTYPNGTIILGDPAKEHFIFAYQGLEEAVDKNLTRSIGVSNFNAKQLERLLKVSIKKPVVNQVECHPYLNQQDLLDFCSANGILLEAYSPLRRGDANLLENEKLREIAKAHNKTVPQVILRWQLQRNVIIIPRTSKQHRMLENFSLFDFKLNQTEMDLIKSLNKPEGQGRVIKFDSTANLPEYPF